MLRPDELASIRGTVNGFLPDLVTISRGGVVLFPQPTMPDGTPLRCRINPDTKETRIEGAQRTDEQRRWRITLPDNTPVQVGDQLLALGNVYSVMELTNPSSYSVSTVALAYMLYDSSGAAVYLRPNATITISRDGIVHLTGLRVHLIPPPKQDTFTALGGVIESEVRIDPREDVAEADALTIVSLDGHTRVDTIATYTLTTIVREAGLLPVICGYFRGYYV